MILSELFLSGAVVGLGATLIADVVGVLRQGWPATNGFYGLVGRWVGSLAHGKIAHRDIRETPPVPYEGVLGWSAHIVLGLCFGIGFVGLFGETALSAPKPWQGITIGLATVLVPWFIFQPLFGWGVAVSNAPKPWKMRLKSIITHMIFGIGLWLCGLGLLLGS